MRSAALDLSWYQYFLLDVIAVLLLAGGAVVAVLFLAVRVFVRKACGLRSCGHAVDSKEKKDD
jgi:hypothetical protein